MARLFITHTQHKRLALAVMEILDTDPEARRLFDTHRGKPTGSCDLCGSFAPLSEIADLRAPEEQEVSACAWGCDFRCGDYPCSGCPTCCPGLRNADFWRRATAHPFAWWRVELPTE